jgi:hypothetical protein
LHDVGRLLSVRQALFDIGYARQEHGIVLVSGVSAKDVLIPVIGRWAMLHDEGRCIHLSRQHSGAETASLAIQVRLEFSLADVDDIGVVKTTWQSSRALMGGISRTNQTSPRVPRYPVGTRQSFVDSQPVTPSGHFVGQQHALITSNKLYYAPA